MPSNSASSGACARTRPPASLIRVAPAEPSLPLPDSTTPTACWRYTSATERKSASTGPSPFASRASVRGVTRKLPSATVITASGGMTYARPGRSFSRARAVSTGILVMPSSNSGRRLLCSADRCWTSNTASGVWGSMARNRAETADQPPADAPTAASMMWGPGEGWSGTLAGAGGSPPAGTAAGATFAWTDGRCPPLARPRLRPAIAFVWIFGLFEGERPRRFWRFIAAAYHGRSGDHRWPWFAVLAGVKPPRGSRPEREDPASIDRFDMIRSPPTSLQVGRPGGAAPLLEGAAASPTGDSGAAIRRQIGSSHVNVAHVAPT